MYTPLVITANASNANKQSLFCTARCIPLNCIIARPIFAASTKGPMGRKLRKISLRFSRRNRNGLLTPSSESANIALSSASTAKSYVINCQRGWRPIFRRALSGHCTASRCPFPAMITAIPGCLWMNNLTFFGMTSARVILACLFAHAAGTA